MNKPVYGIWDSVEEMKKCLVDDQYFAQIFFDNISALKDSLRPVYKDILDNCQATDMALTSLNALSSRLGDLLNSIRGLGPDAIESDLFRFFAGVKDDIDKIIDANLITKLRCLRELVQKNMNNPYRKG